MLTPALPHDETETDTLRLAAARGRRLLAVYRGEILPLDGRRAWDYPTAVSIVADLLALVEADFDPLTTPPWRLVEDAEWRLESLLDAAIPDAERLDERRMEGGS